MLNWFRALWSRGYPASSQTARVSVRVNGDHNNVVTVVVQGSGALLLPMRTTLWTEPPQDPQSVAALLRWNTRLAPLLGREAELEQLRAWAESDAPVSIQLLHAPGGQGKTRLAAEFASVSELAGWRYGWVDLGDFSQAEALTWQGRCLLLVDYPEHHPAQLERLAQAVERAAVQPGQRLRILLVAREAQAVQTIFQNRPCAAWLKPPLALAELPTVSGYALVQAALERLSVFYQRALVPMAQADFDVWRARHPLHHSPLLATALAIDLATNHEERPGPTQWLSGPHLLARLVEHETRWWERTAAGHGAPSGALTTVMAWATLSGRLTDQEINQTLATDLDWSDADRRSIHAALSAVCRRVGAHGWAPVEPDLLAAHFIDGWLGLPARQGREGQDGALAQTLLHAVDPNAFDLHLNRLHMLAYDQTVRLGLRPPGDGHSLERMIWAWAEVQLSLQTALGHRLAQRPGWPGFSWLAAQVSRRRLANLAEGASDAQRAESLNNCAVHFSAAGQWDLALVHARKSVAIYCCLVKVDPEAREPDLAKCLNNLANILSETGKWPEALVEAQLAVQIGRRIVLAPSVANKAILAMGLNNLANRLSENGQWTDALVTVREAVDIRRTLALAQPEIYEPDFAMSLNNLANILSETGDLSSALAAAREAEEIYRRLAHAQPETYEPDLAMSLNNLVRYLSQNPDRRYALVAARDAVSIYRRLAFAQPATYEPKLVKSLNNLANIAGETGDWPGALKTAQDAVNVCRRLVLAQPEAYEPDLAMNLRTLMFCHDSTGDRVAAIKAGEEALYVFSTLAERVPAAFENDRAMTERVLRIVRET